jgi:hypothetical protein
MTNGDPLRDARTDLLKARAERLRRPSSGPKRWFDNAGLLSTVTALATIAATAIAGYSVQRAQKVDDRRFEQRQAMLGRERETIIKINDQTAELLRSVEDRLDLARGRYNHLGDVYLRTRADSTNVVDRRWRHERESTELLVLLSFPSDTSVSGGWYSTRAALQRYSDCVHGAYASATRYNAPENACASERLLAEQTSKALRQVLVKRFEADFARLSGAR